MAIWRGSGFEHELNRDSPFGSCPMNMPLLGAAIKPLSVLAMLRLADVKRAQPGMGAPTQPGTPLGRAPVAPFPAPEMPIVDLAAEIPVMRKLCRQAAHGGR